MCKISSLFFFVILSAAHVFSIQASAATLEHQGTARSYLLVGDPAATTPQPLIVHLHGFRKPEEMADGQNLDAIRWGALGKLAAKEGFLVVQPAAFKGRWNMELDLPNIVLENGQLADDVGFVIKLVDHLIASGVADPARVFLSGISDGGIMTQLILCRTPNWFRAAASLIGTMVETHAKACVAGKPAPILLLAGTHDAVLPYDGWLFPTGRSLSVPEIAEFWRLRHGCTGQKGQMLPDLAKRDYTRVRQVDWTGCRNGIGVRLLRVEGGAHRIPTTSPEKKFTWGWNGQSRDIDAAKQVWQFFQEVEAN